MRLNRATPQWKEPLKTTRIAVTKSRAHWEACRQLVKMTVADFRAHLTRGFQDLPLITAEERNALRKLFKSVSDDSLFWEVVEEADRLISRWLHSGGSGDCWQYAIAIVIVLSQASIFAPCSSLNRAICGLWSV
jgi:hypothetical protein